MDRDSSSCKIPIFVLSFGVIVLNIMMIWLVWIRKQVEGRFQIMLINLGVIDTIYSVSFLLWISVQDRDNDTHFLIFSRFLFQYGKWVRFFSLLWIVTERVLAVYKPIKYRTKYSYYSNCKILTLLWLLPLVCIAISDIKVARNARERYSVAMYGQTVMLVIISCLNIAVPFGISRKSRNSVAVCKPKTAKRSGVIRRKREKKSAILAFFIVSAFIVCNIPAIVSQFWYDKSFAYIVASCSMKGSSFLVSTTLLVVIDIVLDPILYFFANQFSGLSLERTVPERDFNTGYSLKDIVGDKDRLAKVPEEDDGVMGNTSQVRTITKGVSNGEMSSNKGRISAFLTNEIIVHATGSQIKNYKVPVMIEVKSECKVSENACISNCSSYSNILMNGKDMNELSDRCTSNRNESEISRSSNNNNTVTL